MKNNITGWKEFLHEFKRKGQITAKEESVDLCLGCDGFGYVGHEKKRVGDTLEPDYSRQITCSGCGGSGYMYFITYRREDGAVLYMPDEEKNRQPAVSG